jgi:hypothetical protein
MAPRAYPPSLVSFVALALAEIALRVLTGCNRTQVQELHATAEAPRVAAAPVLLSGRLARPVSDRIVAIGDLHGDMDHARRALRLAGAIDVHDRWTRGRLVVVQTGDQMDRGDDDRAIVDLVEDLKGQAAGAGGEFVALLGNHEIMNASLDFRYVTAGGFRAFAPFAPSDASAADGLGPRLRVAEDARAGEADVERHLLDVRELARRRPGNRRGSGSLVHSAIPFMWSPSTLRHF